MNIQQAVDASIRHAIDARVAELTTVYTQLDQQHQWAIAHQELALADAYHVALADVASKLIDLTMGRPI